MEMCSRLMHRTMVHFKVKKVAQCYSATSDKWSIYTHKITKSVKFCGNNNSFQFNSSKKCICLYFVDNDRTNARYRTEKNIPFFK